MSSFERILPFIRPIDGTFAGYYVSSAGLELKPNTAPAPTPAPTQTVTVTGQNIVVKGP